MSFKIVQIKEKDGKVLRQIAKEVKKNEFNSKELNKILSDMKKALEKESDGVALAAPQIAISKRIFIVNPTVYETLENIEELPTVFINPEIIKISKDKKNMEEGCLSVRPLYGKVKRASKATVRALDEAGEIFEMEATGLIAQIFQHEIDHLNGILFIDKAKDLIEMNPQKYEK